MKTTLENLTFIFVCLWSFSASSTMDRTPSLVIASPGSTTEGFEDSFCTLRALTGWYCSCTVFLIPRWSSCLRCHDATCSTVRGGSTGHLRYTPPVAIAIAHAHAAWPPGAPAHLRIHPAGTPRPETPTRAPTEKHRRSPPHGRLCRRPGPGLGKPHCELPATRVAALNSRSTPPPEGRHGHQGG